MMIPALMLLAAQTSAGAPPPPSTTQQQPESQVEAPGPATQAAQQWLALVDAGDAARSYQATGAIFRSKVTQAQWAAELPKARQPMGKVTARHPDGEMPIRSLPDAPAGTYRVVRFETEFASGQQAIETVVMAQEANGWRPVGFFIADPNDQPEGTSAPPSNRR